MRPFRRRRRRPSSPAIFNPKASSRSTTPTNKILFFSFLFPALSLFALPEATAALDVVCCVLYFAPSVNIACRRRRNCWAVGKTEGLRKSINFGLLHRRQTSLSFFFRLSVGSFSSVPPSPLSPYRRRNGVTKGTFLHRVSKR